MQKKIFLSILFVVALYMAKAQLNRYLIVFTDKNNSPYSLQSPSVYLSDSALARRARYGIPLDSSDLPVNPSYIEAVRAIDDIRILNASKWFNRISIEVINPDAITAIQSLPFVRFTQNIGRPSDSPTETETNKFAELVYPSLQNKEKANRNLNTYGLSAAQIQMHQTDFLHRMGFMGESIRLAVIDAGFLRYDILPTFDSIRNNGQIKDTWDFVDNENSVSEDHVHGMQCFSVIGANMPGAFVGSAPKADFYLYRTEDVSSEYPIEEHNLACAAERADSAGVDICSISLGYTNFSDPSFNHTYEEMNGNKCLSSKAVQKGNEKGMLFVVAAGNEGNGPWRYISAPADADSIIAVGAVNGNRDVAGFSSYGPSFDNRIKPDMASHGWGATVANSSTGEPTNGNGTSFACPNLAGVASCLWQGFKEKKQKDIIAALKEASDNFNTPNDRIGYGIPDAKIAFARLQKSTFAHNESFFACKAILTLSIKCNSIMTLHIDRKFPGETDFLPITALSTTEPWGLHSFEWQDELGSFDFPEVSYRFRLSIGNDTSFALDSTILAYSHPCAPSPAIINTDSISVFPNPAAQSAKLNFYSSAEGEAYLDLWNANGKRIYRKKMQIFKGWHTETLDLRTYTPGFYILKIRRPDGTMASKKILITG